MNKNYMYYKVLIKNNIALFVIVFNILISYSQTQKEKATLTVQKTNTSVFFTDAYIYLEKYAVFNVQVEHVILNKKLFGQGVFSISNTKQTSLKVKESIEVDVVFKNTTVSLESEVALTKKVTLVNAKLELNDFNVQSNKEINLSQKSIVIFNGIGRLFISEIQQNSASNDNEVNYNIVPHFGFISKKTKRFVLSNSKFKIQNSKLIFTSIYIKTPKPPPKRV